MITKWNEVTIGMLQEIEQINGLHTSDEEKTFMVTALLAGMPYDEFITLPLDEARDLVAQTSFLQTPPEKVKTKKEYRIGENVYVLQKDIMAVSTAQYIDFQAILPVWQTNLPELMAIVLVPKGKKYSEGYSTAEAVEEIRNNLNIEDALSVADFFSTKSAKSMRKMLLKLEALTTVARWRTKDKVSKTILRSMEKEIKQAREPLYGSGYHWWSQWPK